MKDRLSENEAAFKEAYASLNAAQKEAVDTIDGPVMVVAGPGTGKTQILTLRIANILLKTDTPPESVLALTFTESGAKAMRERLLRYIGTTAYRVPIFTFHGFAQTLIAQYPDAYKQVIGGRPAGDLEKLSIVENIVNDGEVKLLRPLGNPSFYVTPIIRIIGQLKQEYITPDKLAKLVDEQEEVLNGVEKYHTKGAHKGKMRGEYAALEKSVAKNRELVYVYRRYEALLAEQKLYDFEDMITKTVEALRTDRDMLLDLQERYLYLLADEHQDVNGAQNLILELLASFHERPNIFAVGDEKQAIYRFQGASLENFLYFTEKFKDTKVISLTDNYRSGQEILDAAHSLVEVDEGPLQKLRIPLRAKAVTESVLEQRRFSHQAVEESWLLEQIKKEAKRGTDLSEIAVIVRTNREVETVSAMLRKAGLPVTASADSDILQHPITQSVSALLEAVTAGDNEEALFRLLHAPYWGITAGDLVRVLGARSFAFPLVEIIADKEKLNSLGLKDAKKVIRVHQVLERVRKRNGELAVHRLLEALLKESGFIDWVMEQDPYEGARVLRRLYDEMEEMVRQGEAVRLEDMVAAFKTRQRYNLPLNAPFIATDSASVQVMTAHKAKGLEFDTVFMPYLIDRAWSGANKKNYFQIPLKLHFVSKPEAIEDERRLFYVAMTRAKRRLFLSCSELNSEGRELTPARLLLEIDQQYIKTKETKAAEKFFAPLSSLAAPATRSTPDTSFVKYVLSERGFSATSLNNYLCNPWNYFYRNVLRIPEMQTTALQYGTAVHNVLEYTTRNYTKNGQVPDFNAIKKQLERELSRLPLMTEEYSRLLEKGLNELTIYLEHLIKTLPSKTREEFSVRVILPTNLPELPELPLTGKLDRLDFDKDGTLLRVVDYKTGQPKSRNQIEGKTKNSDGNYKRQLVFYALLLELYDNPELKCREGLLSFVQPTAKGEIKEEAFIITDEEIRDLKDTIIKSVKEIVTDRAFATPPAADESDYAALAQMLFKVES